MTQIPEVILSPTPNERTRSRAKKATDNLRAGQALVASTIERLPRGLSDDEILVCTNAS